MANLSPTEPNTANSNIDDRLDARLVDSSTSWRSLTLSFIVHGLLVAILLSMASSFKREAAGVDETDRTGGIVLAQLDAKDDTEYLEPSEVEPMLEPPAEATSPPAAASAPAVSLPIPQVSTGPGLPFDPSEVDVNAMTMTPGTGSSKQPTLSKAHQDLIAADRALVESRKPAGPPTSIRVFGSGELKGRSFLFLLDRSASMGGGGLGVIQAARTELSSAINQLESHHQFQILGYHDQTVPMKQRKLLDATDANKLAAPEFIGNLAAFGATDHRNGLIQAISYKPDVIVLLTDGGLPELNAGELKAIRNAAQKTQIHCIQFGAGAMQQEVNFMTKLAAENNGTFRYVNVNDWNE